ncbi:MAG: tRNA (adenosine(37)-N6)-dimethylallyltransferase MiaA [Bacteroidota bacterium]
MRGQVNTFRPVSTMIVIGGPTASGKTSLAIALAQQLGTEIISADSRQFYTEMRIGNARPSEEELVAVKHHFIADRSIHNPLSAGQFGEEASTLAEQLFEQFEYLVCVGGSGLFINALCEGLDQFPEVTDTARERVLKIWTSAGRSGLQEALAELDPNYYAQVDQQNPRRLMRALEVCYSANAPYSSFLGQKPNRPWKNIFLRTHPERPQLYERINLRVDLMIEQGLEAEAKSLQAHQQLPVMNTVGYQEWWPYFRGEYDKAQAISLIQRNSRRYAKRQVTWFGRGNKYLVVSHVEDCLREIEAVRE